MKRDLKSVITLLLTIALVAATFMDKLDAKDALVPITLSVFAYYFSRKENSNDISTLKK